MAFDVAWEVCVCAMPTQPTYTLALDATYTCRPEQVGAVLASEFGGQVHNMVMAANKSASMLVRLITANFPGFRDEAVYRGRQVCSIG